MARALDLYKKLCLVRFAEEGIIAFYGEDEMKTPMHMSCGQEYIAVGVCHALGDAGQIFATYRNHAAFLARTGNVEKFFLELYGRKGGTADGKAGSMHMIDADAGVLCSSGIVGGCIAAAVGAAFANKLSKRDKIACVFHGDGATDEGVFWESLNAACLYQLPVLFICEDNDLAVHTSKRFRQGFRSLIKAGGTFNCLTYEEKSTDTEAAYFKAKWAVDDMQRTGKPALIRFECYRYLEHVGVNKDYDAGYRSEVDYENWLKRDCLLRQRSQLFADGYTTTVLDALEREIKSQVLAAIQEAKIAARPTAADLLTGTFTEG